jgi:hypothetical protein
MNANEKKCLDCTHQNVCRFWHSWKVRIEETFLHWVSKDRWDMIVEDRSYDLALDCWYFTEAA